MESLLTGTPVIATDFGAFSETIVHGKNGYRFRTIGEAVWAAQNVGRLKPKKIHEAAVRNYSVDTVKYQYEAYFDQLLTLWEEGFYTTHDEGVSKYRRYQRLTG